MGRFKVKAFVEAEQFFKHVLPWPEGVEEVKEPGHRFKVGLIVEVGELIVCGAERIVRIKDGAWVVKGPKGFLVIEDAEFRETYEPVN